MGHLKERSKGVSTLPPVITMKKILTFGLVFILCMCSLAVPAFAADTGGAGYGVAVDGTTFNRHGGGGGTPGSLTDNSNSGSGYYGDIESPSDVLGMNEGNKVTISDVDSWVARKGNDLIGIVTKGAQVVSVLGFFGALFLIIVGALGNKRTMAAGFVALAISCGVFTAATCAPQIMTAVRGWLIS